MSRRRRSCPSRQDTCHARAACQPKNLKMKAGLKENIRNMLQTCSKKCKVDQSCAPLVIKCHQSLRLATPPKSAPPSSLGSMESRPPALHQLGGGGVATAPGHHGGYGNDMGMIWHMGCSLVGMQLRYPNLWCMDYYLVSRIFLASHGCFIYRGLFVCPATTVIIRMVGHNAGRKKPNPHAMDHAISL